LFRPPRPGKAESRIPTAPVLGRCQDTHRRNPQGAGRPGRIASVAGHPSTDCRFDVASDSSPRP
jgi:hypothetical protein